VGVKNGRAFRVLLTSRNCDLTPHTKTYCDPVTSATVLKELGAAVEQLVCCAEINPTGSELGFDCMLKAHAPFVQN
jgi:hypothetical protein